MNILNGFSTLQKKRWRLFIVVIAALTLELIFAFQYHYMRDIIRDEMEHRAETELIIKAIMAKSFVDNSERSLKSHIMEVKYNLANPDSMMAIMNSITKYTPNLIGCGIAFKPYYYEEKDRLFEPYAFRTDSGIVCLQIAGKAFDYTRDGFYRNIQEKKQNCWVGPYHDAYLKRQVITYAVPIYEFTGDTVAVFGIDVDTQNLGDTLNHRHLYPSSFNILLTKEGQLIAGPTNADLQDKVKKLIDIINDSTIKKTWNEEGTMRIARHFDKDRNDELSIFFATIKNTPQWQIAVVCYDDEVYGKLNRVTLYIMLLMLAGISVLGGIIWRFYLGEKHLQQTRLEQARITGELHIANEIQQALLSRSEPSLVGVRSINVEGRLIPAKEVGGDLYNAFVRNDKLFFCIGDVSGKGVPAALIMAITQALFRDNASREDNPAHIMKHLNETACAGNDRNIFVTLFIGVLDLPTGHLRYCNAGHELPILVEHSTKDDCQCSLLEATPNLPIGLFNDFTYETQSLSMKSGSALFLYTDGLSEARNAQGQLYGREKVMETIGGTASTDPKRLVETAINQWKHFADATEQSDDLTLLALSYTPPNEPHLIDKAVTLQNSVREVETLGSFIKDIMRQMDVGGSLANKIRLAVEEAVVNVMEYAYPTGHTGRVDIHAIATPHNIKFIITDSGIPFNPTEVPNADTTLSLEERPVGGLGILLVRQLMDSINYERIDGKNVLTLSKTINHQ